MTCSKIHLLGNKPQRNDTIIRGTLKAQMVDSSPQDATRPQRLAPRSKFHPHDSHLDPNRGKSS